MGIEKQAGSTVVFAIALSFALGVFLSLVISVTDKYKVFEDDGALTASQNRTGESQPRDLTQREYSQAWLLAMNALIQVRDRDDDGSNAGYKFEACFLMDDECVFSGRAVREEFEKTTFYFPPSRVLKPENHVMFYLNLRDGEVPHLMMRFVYFGKDWEYIERVLVLVEDEFALDSLLPEAGVRRQAFSGTMVYEYADLVLSDKIAVIGQIADAGKLAIRIEGRVGVADLNEAMLENAKVQAQEIIVMYALVTEAIERALLEVLSSRCDNDACK